MVQRKPKKKKNREDLPEGMTRREAKLAARAAERNAAIDNLFTVLFSEAED